MSLPAAPASEASLGRLDEPALLAWLSQAIICHGVLPAGAGGAGWQRLPRLAESQGCAPLLYHALRRSPVGAHPAALLRLEQAYLQSTAHNALLFHELARLLDAFQRHSVPVVLLKGAALAVSLYPEAGLRPMNDLDLLIQPEQLGQALDAARECGYRAQKVTYHAVLWGGPRDRVTVEIHWSLIPEGQTGNAAWFWGRLAPWSLEGRSWPCAAALDPAANLLYLAAHLVLQHGASNPRLVWYYDLHLLLTHQGNELDWPAILEQARRLGWSAALLSALQGAVERFASPVPQTVLAALRLDAAHAPARPPALPADEAGSIRRWMLSAQARLGWRERLLGLWRLLVPLPEYMRWSYRPHPAWLWPLYYPVRWAQIAWQTFRSLARRR